MKKIKSIICLLICFTLKGNAQIIVTEKLPTNTRNSWSLNIIKRDSIRNDLHFGVAPKTAPVSKINNLQSNSVKKLYILKDANVAFSNDIIETTPNNYITIGQTYDTIGSQLHWRLTLTGIDQNYNLMWKKSFGNNNFNYVHHLFMPIALIKKNNFIYSALFVEDSVNKQPGVFIKFDFNGDTIWQKKYYVNNDQLFITAVCPTVDNGFLITGAIQTNTPSFNNHPIVATYLFKTDCDGNKLWDKKFYKSNLDDSQIGYKILQDSLTKKIIIVGAQTSTIQNSNLQILDSIGNLISEFGSNGSFGNALVNIIKLKDGNFATVGVTNHYEYLITGTATGASTLIKFDIQGNIIFKKEYDTLVVNNVITNIIESENCDFITGGVVSTLQQYNMGENDISRIMRIDKNGNMLWKKYFDNFTNNTNQDAIGGMILTTDGHIAFTIGLIGGIVPRPLNYSFYKTDTSYCDMNAFACTDYTGLNEYENFNEMLKIYPNPASKNVTIEFLKLNNVPFKIEVTNNLGQSVFVLNSTIQQSYTIDASDFLSGLYTINIIRKNQIVFRQKIVIIK